jgi:hypothetical protein
MSRIQPYTHGASNRHARGLPYSTLAFGGRRAHNSSMVPLHFDRTDYSVVVKYRAPAPNSWKWEIYRAGRSIPIKKSSGCFGSMVMARRAGKEALKALLDKLQV